MNMIMRRRILPVFFFNDTATTEIYTLSLHDALPISSVAGGAVRRAQDGAQLRLGQGHHVSVAALEGADSVLAESRSEEHTSELQSHLNLVCRLLLEKKNIKKKKEYNSKFVVLTRT